MNDKTNDKTLKKISIFTVTNAIVTGQIFINSRSFIDSPRVLCTHRRGSICHNMVSFLLCTPRAREGRACGRNHFPRLEE